VVLVQVRQDSGVDIGRGVPERGELGGEGVLLADVEAGEPAIQPLCSLLGRPPWVKIGLVAR
jgi:hypothetical protein